MQFTQTAYKLTFNRDIEVGRAVPLLVSSINPFGKNQEPARNQEMEERYTIKKGSILFSLEEPGNEDEVSVKASENDFLSDLNIYGPIPTNSFHCEKVQIKTTHVR
jgi:hypothetical protein